MIDEQESPQPSADHQPEEDTVRSASADDRPIDSHSDDDVFVSEDHRASHEPNESTITFEEWLEARATVGEISQEEKQVELDAYSSPQNAHWRLVDDFYVGLEMAAEYLQEGHTLSGPEFQRSWVTLGEDSERPFGHVLEEVAGLADRHSVDSTPLDLLLTNGPVTLQDLRGAQAVVGRLRRIVAIAPAAAATPASKELTEARTVQPDREQLAAAGPQATGSPLPRGKGSGPFFCQKLQEYVEKRREQYNRLVPEVMGGANVDKYQAIFGPIAVASAILREAGCDISDKKELDRVDAAIKKCDFYKAEIQPVLSDPPRRPENWDATEPRGGEASDILKTIQQKTAAMRKRVRGDN